MRLVSGLLGSVRNLSNLYTELDEEFERMVVRVETEPNKPWQIKQRKYAHSPTAQLSLEDEIASLPMVDEPKAGKMELPVLELDPTRDKTEQYIMYNQQLIAYSKNHKKKGWIQKSLWL